MIFHIFITSDQPTFHNSTIHSKLSTFFKSNHKYKYYPQIYLSNCRISLDVVNCNNRLPSWLQLLRVTSFFLADITQVVVILL